MVIWGKDVPLKLSEFVTKEKVNISLWVLGDIPPIYFRICYKGKGKGKYIFMTYRWSIYALTGAS